MDLSPFIAGALGGAIATGAFALILEAVRGRRERDGRFVQLKREKYALLLTAVDSHLRLLARQRVEADDFIRGEGTEVTTELPPTDDVENLANEIDLLSLEVGRLANRLVRLTQQAQVTYAWNAALVDEKRLPLGVYLMGAIGEVEQVKSAFVEAARRDIGTK